MIKAKKKTHEGKEIEEVSTSTLKGQILVDFQYTNCYGLISTTSVPFKPKQLLAMSIEEIKEKVKSHIESQRVDESEKLVREKLQQLLGVEIEEDDNA